MKWFVALIPLSVGYLAWRGSGNLLRAIIAAVLVPIIALILLGLMLGSSVMAEMSPPILTGLVIAMIAGLAIAHS